MSLGKKKILSQAAASGITATDHFTIKLYTGTGSSQSIDTDFKPDLVWIKRRESENHRLFDSIRGSTKLIYSNATNAEVTDANSLTSFDSNGFSLGTSSGENVSGGTFVAWCWKAGGSAVSNTNGSITSTVSANTAAGFSIVKFTTNLSSGQSTTVGHGLSNSPELIITKNLDNTYNWWVSIDGISGFSQDDHLSLNQNTAKTNISQPFGRATSTVFSISEAFSGSGTQNLIAYCFHSVDDYQKIGSYTGDGGTNNAINLGFQPRWVMIKLSSHSGQNWYIMDDQRENTSVEKALSANLSDSEETLSNHLDFTSTGFKLTKSSGAFNQSGYTYIYLAIA